VLIQLWTLHRVIYVHKFSNTLNFVILHNDEINAYKFSDFMNFVNWYNQLAIHFAGTNLSEKTKNAKIAKFSVSLN